MPDEMPRGPLGHLRVLDLTQSVAGPYATKLFAGLGAEVIKIERPGGDPCRSWSPTCPGGSNGPHSALFSYLNINKKSVGLDLKTEGGRKLLLGLVGAADVVVENFKPGVIGRLRLGYEELQRRRPGLVLTSISNYGQTGSFRDFEGTELNIFAFGGRMAARGIRPRAPVRLLAGSSLFIAGTVAAGATLVARRDGAGDHIDISIANVILGQPDRMLCLYSYSGVDIERPEGPQPFQTWAASDGFVVINLNRGIERVAEMIGHPDLMSDPRFASNASRLEHAADLEPIILEWTTRHTKAEIVELSLRFRVVAAPIATIPEVLSDSHLEAREYFRGIPDAACPCEATQPGLPLRIHTAQECGWVAARRAPGLGEDTRSVLGTTLGLSRGEVEKHLESGAAFERSTDREHGDGHA